MYVHTPEPMKCQASLHALMLTKHHWIVLSVQLTTT